MRTTQEQPRQWVKIKGSDVRVEYGSRRVDHPDGVHWHFEDDPATAHNVKCTPTLLQDNGDGTYTRWGYTIWGAVGHTGRLRPEIEVVPLSTERDFAEAARIVRMIESATRSQTALYACEKARAELLQ